MSLINRIRVAGTDRTVDAEVFPCAFQDMVVWQRRIQPFVEKTRGIGSDWNWPAYYLGCHFSEMALGRAALAIQIRVEGPDGEGVPVGQGILSVAYHFPNDRKLGCVFAWFLMATPRDALMAHGISNRFAVMAPLLDTAIQLSIAWHQVGRIGLHAAFGATQQESDALSKKYLDYGLHARPKGKWWFVFPFRKDDGRLFYWDTADALTFAAKQDDLR